MQNISRPLYSFLDSLFFKEEGEWVFIFWILSSSRFLLIGFLGAFLLLLKYYHIIFIIIVFWLGNDRPSGLFFSCLIYFFLTHASLLTFFVGFFVLFHSCCSQERVLGKTLVHELPISFSHTKWYLFLFTRNDVIEMVALWKQWIIANGALLNKFY